MSKKPIIIISVIITLIISLYYLILPLYLFEMNKEEYFTNNSSTIITGSSDTAFGGIFEVWQPDDSLPHYVYKQKADSAQRIRDKRKRMNESPSLSGWSTGYIGFYYDNPHRYSTDTINTKNKYYFAINKCELDGDNRFFIKNETYNLVYEVKDSVQYEGGDSTTYSHYKSKQIPARYDSKEKQLLIPINESQYKFYSTLTKIILYGYMALMYYLLIGSAIKIVVSISQGNAFTLANIKRFRMMGFAIVFYILGACFFPSILKLIFSKYLIQEFRLPVLTNLFIENFFTLFFSVGLFITAQAFKRGYKLQQEQDLTI